MDSVGSLYPYVYFFGGAPPFLHHCLSRKRALFHQYLAFSLASFLIQGLLCMYNAASIAALALQGSFVVQRFFGSVTQPLTSSPHHHSYPLLQKDWLFFTSDTPDTVSIGVFESSVTFIVSFLGPFDPSLDSPPLGSAPHFLSPPSPVPIATEGLTIFYL